jgi:hypothetical protein
MAGRPRKHVDALKVEQLAGVGCTPEEIGLLLDASSRTITRNYDRPFQKGQSKLRHTLKRTLFKEATSGNTAALIFATKVYCGLKETADTTINVSATAVGGQVIFSEETKKQLEDFHVKLQQRVFQRTYPKEHLPNANGESPALN